MGGGPIRPAARSRGRAGPAQGGRPRSGADVCSFGSEERHGDDPHRRNESYRSDWLGLVASLARPGGNVTGVSYSVGAEIFGKDLELLKEVVPRVRRVAVLSNPASPARPLTISNVKDAARSLGLQLQLLEARGPRDFDGAFAAMAKERVGALLVVTDPAFIPHRARLVDLAVKNRLPSIFTQREHAEAGGLMSYGPRLSDLHRRGATYVDKILKGAKPADLPVEEPTKFELVVNLKTAKALGLTIPQSLLQRADQVIE
jgi:ABC-type uncharacterized transport system substrate-binding protein